LLSAVAENGLHFDGGRFKHHRASVSDGAFTRIKFVFDVLRVRTLDLEIDVIARPASCRMMLDRNALHRSEYGHEVFLLSVF
jgi:hypothetical protein